MSKIRRGITRELSPRRLRSGTIVPSDEGGTSTTMGGRPGVKRMGQQYEPTNSGSDMPRRKSRRVRPCRVPEEMDTNSTPPNTGKAASTHMGTNEPGAVEAGEGYGEMGRDCEEEGYGMPEEVVSVGAEMRVDPYGGEEEEEEGGEESDGGPSSAKSCHLALSK